MPYFWAHFSATKGLKILRSSVSIQVWLYRAFEAFENDSAHAAIMFEERETPVPRGVFIALGTVAARFTPNFVHSQPRGAQYNSRRAHNGNKSIYLAALLPPTPHTTNPNNSIGALLAPRIPCAPFVVREWVYRLFTISSFALLYHPARAAHNMASAPPAP
jgi:hypothetical protein